jgi:hypothetical protein
MEKQFDELPKSLKEGVSRPDAFRKSGLRFAVILLAGLTLFGALAKGANNGRRLGQTTHNYGAGTVTVDGEISGDDGL